MNTGKSSFMENQPGYDRWTPMPLSQSAYFIIRWHLNLYHVSSSNQLFNNKKDKKLRSQEQDIGYTGAVATDPTLSQNPLI